jgi:hypothetical protein
LIPKVGRHASALFDKAWVLATSSLKADLDLAAHARKVTHTAKKSLFIPFMLTPSDDPTHRLCAFVLEALFLRRARIPPSAQVKSVILPNLDFAVDVWMVS